MEAGKKAAGIFLDLLQQVKAALTPDDLIAERIASNIGADPEDVYHCLNHLAANGSAKVSHGRTPADDTFCSV